LALTAGTRLGPYEILSPLGAGGMGEVYRAKDPRLGRDVAIKVLPESFSADRDRLRRFEQEARAAGILNHPNVTAVYDVGTHEGMPYVVQELLEGETLRSVLALGRLSPRKAIDYSQQVAQGLAAAHEKAIVHRDLKPENLFVTREGRVKILDFGLAKLLQPETGAAGTTQAPTATAASQPGTVLGTLGYMSPEQVRGQPADARSDIFSFGAILYEMLSGERAFRGDSAAETMSAILKEEPPDLSVTGGRVPQSLEHIVRHCLEKSPEQRFQSARDLGFALGSIAAFSSAVSDGAKPASGISWRPIRATVLLLLAGLAGALLGRRFLSSAPSEPAQLKFVTSSGDDWAPSASPDGKTLAFVSDRDGTRRIWLKQVELGGEVALTEGPDENPRFSPDGSTVLFERTAGSRRSLYGRPVLGGETRRIVDGAWGGDWSPDGRRIVYVRLGPSAAERPFRTDRFRTGTASIVTALADGSEPAEVGDFSPLMIDAPPRWSPDGRWIALAVTKTSSTLPAQIVLISPDGRRRRSLDPARKARIGAMEWNGPGELVYPQPDSLNWSQFAAAGSVILQNVETGHSRTLISLPRASTMVTVLGRGRIAFDLTSARQTLREVAFGSPFAAARSLTAGNTSDRQPAYAPSGEWVVFSSGREGHLNLWKVSTKSGAVRRLTFGPSNDWDPAFSNGGRGILFSSNRSGVYEIWTADSEGGDARQVSHDGVDAENPSPTPDGSWIVYSSGGDRGLWKVRPDGSGATRLAVGSGMHPEVSPDGLWVLYFDQTHRSFILRVVALADGRPAPFEIAGLADGRARWMPDGRRIVFRDRDELGRWALYGQAFAPGSDTRSTRQLLLDSPSETEEIETFSISPDGSQITVAVIDWESGILMAERLAGIGPGRAER
jgi:serine/threonine protein kinase